MVVDVATPARTFKSNWAASHWRGAFTTLLDAGETAAKQLPSSHPCSAYIALTFSDGGGQNFDSFDDARIAAKELDPAEVYRLFIRVGGPAAGGSDEVIISGSQVFGVALDAEGPDRVFVYGIVALLETTLREGRTPPVLPGRRRLTNREKVRCVGAALCPIVALVAALSLDIPYFLVVAFTVFGLVPSVPIWPIYDSLRVPAPRLRLVGEGESLEPSGVTPSGFVWQVKSWFERHPFWNLLIGFLLAVLADLVGTLISGKGG